MDEISPQELQARLAGTDRPLLLDVRQDWETRLCRLENAVPIPIEEIEMRADPLNAAAASVVYCPQGVRSAAGAAARARGMPAVNGPCRGAGFELALACDLRVAAASASFGLPEVRVGVPSVIQAALLPPMIGPGRAAEMLLTGAPITAGQALQWGLVNRVVPDEGLTAAVDELAAPILASGPEAI